MGFAFAPLPVVAPVLLMFGAILARAPIDWAAASTAMLQVLALIYGATLIVGVPLHLLLHRTRRYTLLAYIGGAVAAVVTTFGVVAIADRLRPTSANASPFALHPWSGAGVVLAIMSAFFAAIAAAIFWIIAVKQRNREVHCLAKADAA